MVYALILKSVVALSVVIRCYSSTMLSAGKPRSVDFYREIPRDLTKASWSRSRISILATLFVLLLSGMVLRATGFEVHSGLFEPGDDTDEDHGDVSISLSSNNFDQYSHKYPILVVSFYAPWCHWSKRLRPAWEKAAKIIRERYDPETDGRIMVGKVDCAEQTGLCNRNHVQGYPSIRIFRNGSDFRDDNGRHGHESYYGDRDSESLVAMMESLVAPIKLEPQPQGRAS